MNDILKEAESEKNILLENMNTVIISTVNSENIPNASYAPAAVDSDNNFFIYISNLSKHSHNLRQSSQASIMIIEDEIDSENIFGRKRLTLDISVSLIERESDNWSANIKLLEDKFGETLTYLKKLTDFNLFKLSPINGLLVYGFGKAFKFSDSKLTPPMHINEVGHSKK